LLRVAVFNPSFLEYKYLLFSLNTSQEPGCDQHMASKKRGHWNSE